MSQIPPEARGYEDFPGTIGQTFADSTPAWRRPRQAPKDAPNVVVVLLDDMGYSDIGPFGSEIDTPYLDQIAREGTRLTNYHTTPVCSPARAALLTGINPHRAGFASVANSDPGFPNLRLELADDVQTLPEILRANGYATFGVGKWHLTRDNLMNDGASKESWPLQRGFDRYYGSLEGLNSFFAPNRLIRDNSPVEVDTFPEDYYLTDDYTDQAIGMITSLRASDAVKPFFLYFAHTAMHGPHGAKEVDIDKYRGTYDKGWDEIRLARFEKQKRDGLFPAETQLPPATSGPGFEVPRWDELTDEQRSRFAQYMEVYAAMVDNVDQSLGRILELLETLGERENTIVVFTSDNGGTCEGGPEGTRSYFSQFVHIPGLPESWDTDVAIDDSLIGGPRTMTHYPRGWASVSNTPFRYYKGQTFAGGIRVPFLLSWPRGLERAQSDPGIRDQFQYVTDILPTIVELTGVTVPDRRQGVPVKDIDGTSFVPVVRDDAPSQHRVQYSEFAGHRGLYHDGWKLVTLHRPGTAYSDQEWQLYHLATDPTEMHDVAAEYPAVVNKLARLWQDEAWRNTVFPMTEGFGLGGRSPLEERFAAPVTLVRQTPTLERYRSGELISLRSFTVSITGRAHLDDEGVLVAHGDQGGGYVVYVAAGSVTFVYNAYGRLYRVSAPFALNPSGRFEVQLSATWQPDFAWAFELKVGGGEPARLDTVPMLVGMAPWTGIRVGRCSGGPVDWELFTEHGSYPFSGDQLLVRYVPGQKADYDRSVISEIDRAEALYYD